MIRDDKVSCSRADNDHMMLRIRNNRVDVAWGRLALQVDIITDGSFDTTALRQWANKPIVDDINGKITGDTLEADIGNSRCSGHLSLKKE